jgi:inward rectifier potassium channel
MPRRHHVRDFKVVGGVSREGRLLRIRATGLGRWHPGDLYHELLQMTWPRAALVFVAAFTSFNLFFGWLYWLDPHGIALGAPAAEVWPFWQAFFFSVQTVATIGYGHIYPQTIYANILVVVEITFGILFFALVTGIVFARFSRPTARILFSNCAVVQDIGGIPTFTFRAANLRHNLVFEAHATVSLLTDEKVAGMVLRRFRDLKLTREANPVFALTWTIMHPIDARSPLAGWLAGQQAEPNSDIVVVISGVDDRTGQSIHGRWVYDCAEIVWDGRFVDILDQLPDGTRTIDYRRFHDIEKSKPAES